jgi:UDP-glucuronate decarboxylase
MNSDSKIVGPINLGNPTESTIKEIAQGIIRLTNSKSKIVNLELPSDDPRQRNPDISEAKQKLNWEPKVALEDGLRSTINYFSNLNHS